MKNKLNEIKKKEPYAIKKRKTKQMESKKDKLTAERK